MFPYRLPWQSLTESRFTEFAEYTSAQERIALGKKSRKKEAQKRREEMTEMIVDAWVPRNFQPE